MTLFLLMRLLSAQALEPGAATPPDVAIFASARAREVRFTSVPENTRIVATGSVNEVASSTVARADRQNLPDRVQPFVTYRDVGIRLTITSTLPDIERILDEALREPAEPNRPRN